MFSRPLCSALALGLISALALAPAAQAADIRTLIQQKKDSGDKGPYAPYNVPYVYTVTADVKSGEGEKANAYIAVYKVHPGAAPGQRVTLIGSALEDFPQDFQNQINRLNTDTSEAEFAEEFWCTETQEDADEDDLNPDDFTVIREDAAEALISLNPDALKDMMQVDMGGGGGDMPKKVLKRLASEFTITKPDLNIRNMKIWLTRPTTIKIVAKLKEMNIEQSCKTAPNGLPYVSERKVKVSGKALGKSFKEDMVLTVSDLQPL